MNGKRARLALLVAAFMRPGFGADLYVSPLGSDAGDGKSATPFRTVERAIAGVRDARLQGGDAVTVWISPGTYRLERTIELTTQHSGTTLRAQGKGAVRISGGRELPPERFTPATNPRLDLAARGHVMALDLKSLGISEFGDAASVSRAELIFNDAPLQLARWPDQGFSTDLQTAGGEPFIVHGVKGERSGVLAFAGNRPGRWVDEKDLLLHGYWFWDWRDGYQRLESIDPVQKLLKLKPPQHQDGYRSGARYYALNALVELDRPGEWYLDRDEAVLYIWPPGPLAGSRVVLSQIDAPLVALRDASDIELRGLTFEAGRREAIEITGGRRNIVRDCAVRNVGGDAIVVSGGYEHRIENCDISHVAAAAIVVSGGDRPTLKPGGHTIHGNRIRDYARIKRTYAAGIRLDGVGHRVTNNDIANAPHLAIYFFGNDHRIERNEIHDVVRETGDAGAIYTGRDWTARGTIIRHNYIHDVRGPGLHGAQAIYLDDAASGIVVAGNILQRVDRAILAGGGRDNVIEDNRMLECTESLLFDNRGLNWMKGHVTPPDGRMVRLLAAMPVAAPPWSERYPRLARLMDDEPGAPKYNVVRRNIVYSCAPPQIAPEVAAFGTVGENVLVRESPGLGDLPLSEIGVRGRR